MTDVSFLWFANRASYRNTMSTWLFVEADVARIIAHLLSGAGSMHWCSRLCSPRDRTYMPVVLPDTAKVMFSVVGVRASDGDTEGDLVGSEMGRSVVAAEP